jgi:hypothetical protein
MFRVSFFTSQKKFLCVLMIRSNETNSFKRKTRKEKRAVERERACFFSETVHQRQRTRKGR